MSYSFRVKKKKSIFTTVPTALPMVVPNAQVRMVEWLEMKVCMSFSFSSNHSLLIL